MLTPGINMGRCSNRVRQDCRIATALSGVTRHPSQVCSSIVLALPDGRKGLRTRRGPGSS